MGPEINLARVFNTRVSSQELIAMINEDFGLDTAGKGKVLMLKDLYEHLIKEYEQGRRSVVIIDEAQNLSLDLLEEVRMLSNLETNEATLLQIMLVGQPQLGRILSLAEMRQFRQRISIVCHILPLTRQETEDYILHRLAVAGNRDALSFHDGAFDAIHEISDGIPRKINMLCNFLLLTAFTEERRDVPVEMVRDVAGGLGLQKNAELDSNAAYPSAMRQTPGNDDRINKGALLRALGLESPVSGNHTRTASGADSAGDANEYPAAIRSIGLRLHALEKGMEHVGKKDHAEPAKRAEAPETRDAGSPARQRTDRQNIATDHPAQDAGSPAGQRTVRQDIVTDHPGQPYCDLPSGKRPR
jgi:hypothetical protein